MANVSTRIFVANLPTNAKESELKKLFSDYGEVTNVELKTKENPYDIENVKVIAFITLSINTHEAHDCVNNLHGYKLNGSKLSVSIAKESFLERLKRERQEAEAAATAGPSTALSHSDINEQSSKLLSQPLANSRRKFAEDESFEGLEDEAPELFITKKRAASSIHNGKIVIQRIDVEPIHVIEKKADKKAVKQLDEKSLTADLKRKESLNKKKNQYQQKKGAIQAALSNMDSQPRKKIKFSDSDNEDNFVESKTGKSHTKVKLFGGSDDDAEEDKEDFNLKPEHFSRKGEKLLQLQSKQSLDPRFKLNANFVEDDDDDDDGQTNKENHKAEGDNERDWQMNILEQVVGSKVDTGNPAQRAAQNKRMLRFDPVRPEHQKLLRTHREDVKGIRAKNKANQNDQEAEQEEIEESNSAKPQQEVSKEVFYMVTDTLTESLKTRGDGFSLLNMFGKANELEVEREQQLKKLTNEKILVSKLDKPLPNNINAFAYDSSSEEEDLLDSPALQKTGDVPHEKSNKKGTLCVETFFIHKGDPRLKEGLQFFKFERPQDEENYDEKRQRLKSIIKKKISKSKKNVKHLGASGRRAHKTIHKVKA